MDVRIIKLIEPLIGKNCCRIKVGAYKSLSLGFGEKQYHNNSKLNDDYYGEWELGTYYCSWRIMLNNKILCASNDAEEVELNNQVAKITFGVFESIEMLTNIDVRIKLSNNIIIDFLATIKDDDEYFHVFLPNDNYIELRGSGKWKIGKSSF